MKNGFLDLLYKYQEDNDLSDWELIEILANSMDTKTKQETIKNMQTLLKKRFLEKCFNESVIQLSDDCFSCSKGKISILTKSEAVDEVLCSIDNKDMQIELLHGICLDDSEIGQYRKKIYEEDFYYIREIVEV